MNARPAAALAAALLVLTACSDGGEDTAAPAPAAPVAESCPDAPATVAPPAGASTDLDAKPEVEVPDGPPPTTLEVADVLVGEGDVACTGDTVAMQYVGVTYEDGEEFDASWERGEPFTFELGSGMVIPGWDEGIVGMRQGGRRLLVIPPDLAYGERGAGDVIPPGATLVFAVDLVGVTKE